MPPASLALDEDAQSSKLYLSKIVKKALIITPEGSTIDLLARTFSPLIFNLPKLSAIVSPRKPENR